MGVAADLVRQRGPAGTPSSADLDGGQVERVEDQLDPAPDQCGST